MFDRKTENLLRFVRPEPTEESDVTAGIRHANERAQRLDIKTLYIGCPVFPAREPLLFKQSFDSNMGISSYP
jgi:hypothetical protein